MDMNDLRATCVDMKALQDRKEAVEAQLTELNKALEIIRVQTMPSMMETLGLRNATFEGLGRVQLASDLHASTREGQKTAAMQWLRDCGYEGMITETYNASSLKALFRRQLTEGVDIPDAIFNVSPFTRASIVKA